MTIFTTKDNVSLSDGSWGMKVIGPLAIVDPLLTCKHHVMRTSCVSYTMSPINMGGNVPQGWDAGAMCNFEG